MNKTIGIFGGGQLGRMMAQAALPLNIQCTFFEANHNCPSAILGQVFSEHDVQGLENLLKVQMYFPSNLKIRLSRMLILSCRANSFIHHVKHWLLLRTVC